jgi:hypothetical protein
MGKVLRRYVVIFVVVENIDGALFRNSRVPPPSGVEESNQSKSNNGDKPTRDTTSNCTSVGVVPVTAA